MAFCATAMTRIAPEAAFLFLLAGAIAVYDDLIKRFGEATEPALRETLGVILYQEQVLGADVLVLERRRLGLRLGEHLGEALLQFVKGLFRIRRARHLRRSAGRRAGGHGHRPHDLLSARVGPSGRVVGIEVKAGATIRTAQQL